MNLPIGTITTKEMSEIPPDLINGLTERQKQVLELIVKGYSSRMVGDVLYLKEKTVKFHLTPIYKHFNVKNRVELLLKLFNKGQQ